MRKAAVRTDTWTVPACRGNADATAALMRCSAPAFRLCSAAVAAFAVAIDVDNSRT